LELSWDIGFEKLRLLVSTFFHLAKDINVPGSQEAVWKS